MSDTRHRPLIVCLWIGMALVGALFSGCTAVRLAGGGLSVAKSTVKATGAIGGAAVKTTGSAVGILLPDGDEPVEQKPEEPREP